MLHCCTLFGRSVGFPSSCLCQSTHFHVENSCCSIQINNSNKNLFTKSLLAGFFISKNTSGVEDVRASCIAANTLYLLRGLAHQTTLSLQLLTKWCGVRTHCCVFVVVGGEVRTVTSRVGELVGYWARELHGSKSHQGEVTFWEMIFSVAVPE